MTLATQADLADRLGRDLTAAEVRQAAALLQDATAIILDRFPQYDTAPTPASTAVCCAMVLRVLRNPAGLRSETVDDYTYTIDSARSSGELYMTENEIDTLTPVRTNSFSIVPSAPLPPVVYAVIDPSPAIKAGRAAHLGLMLDRVSIVRPGTPVWDEAAGDYVPSSTPVYTGQVRLVAWRGNEEHAAEAEVALIRYRLALPADGSLPALARRDVATVIASLDSALLGAVLVLTEPELATTSSALRWIAEIVA